MTGAAGRIALVDMNRPEEDEGVTTSTEPATTAEQHQPHGRIGLPTASALYIAAVLGTGVLVNITRISVVIDDLAKQACALFCPADLGEYEAEAQRDGDA